MMPARPCPRCQTPMPTAAGPVTCPGCGVRVRFAVPAAPVAPPPRSRRWPVVAGGVAAAVVAAAAVAVLARPQPEADPVAPAAVAAVTPPPATPVAVAAPLVPAVIPPVVAVAPPPRPAVVPDRPESAELAWAFAYDAAGRLTRATNPAGQPTTVRYEPADAAVPRKVVRESADGAVTVEFDPAGRRTAMTDPAGSVTYARDGLGRLTAVRRAGGPAVAFTYDTLDRPAAVAVGDDHTVTTTYDHLGRVAALDTPAGRVEYAYSAKDRTVARTLPNGVRTTWTRTPAGRLDRIEHAAAGRRLLSLAYQYRPDGLIRSVAEATPDGEATTTYEYDTVGRLVTATTGGRRSTYTYDLLGNRLTVTDGDRTASTTFDWIGRLMRQGGERAAHDGAGNLARYAGGRGPVTLTHSTAGQLTSVAVGGTRVGLTYDGDGNLIGREAADGRTAFVPDPRSAVWRPLLATDARGNRTAYLWDGDAPLAVREGGKWRFLLGDHLDTVRRVVDAGGAEVGRPGYCPFGRPLAEPAGEFGPGFGGLFFDRVTGLYLTRARAYDPALGRFVQPDPEHRVPTGSQKDLIAYTYCGNDPVNFADPDGCQPQPFEVRPSTPTVNYNGYRVSDPGIRTVLDQLSQHFGRPVTVTSGDRGMVVQGSSPRSHHLQHRAADFHVQGMSDRAVYNQLPAAMRQVFDPGQRYQVVLHGGSTATSGPHLHVGRYPDGAPGVVFTTEGLTPATRGRYDRQYQAFPAAPSPAPSPTPTPAPTPTPTPAPPPPPPGGGGAMAPARVGGVALAGGGQALDGFGQLDGVALDADGRLVLLAGKATVELPPLRLDDIVTVFRSVYDHGDAPSVSIDPVPADPNGPVMNIRHGPGTADTYVGWVLFEADRVMKTYSLGQDNQTGKPFRSKVPGYDRHLALRFGDRAAKGKERWERFWIVPARVTHRAARDGRAALTGVPLKLRTEAMVMKGGKLETAPGGQSSPGAAYFSTWFTDNYDKIAAESRSVPPAGSGMAGEVAVLAELKRVAVLAAVAERLRDTGVPMPGWMRDYPVRPFPFPATTPSTTITSEKKTAKGVTTYSVYGGVTLSPPREDVRTEAAAEADGLAPRVRAAVAAVPPLTPVAVPGDGGNRRAAALPGTDAVAVGGNHLAEEDLAVPVGDGRSLRLVRRSDSFHAPADAFGPGWTLDLPRLVERPGAPGDQPGTRRVYFELESPLGSAGGVFRDIRPVPGVGRLMVPAAAGTDMLGLADSTDFGGPTHVLIFADGRRWHFDPAGDLVATVQAPLTVRYHRDPARRVTRIEAAAGPHAAAVALTYDDRGRVKSAAGGGRAVSYRYDAAGRLERADRPGGRVEYRYDAAGRVAAVRVDGREARAFEYAAGGRLTAEKRPDGTTTFDVTAGPAGTTVTARTAGRAAEAAEYDAAFRPLRRTLADGTRVGWVYADDGSAEVTTTPADGTPPRVVRRSADGRREEAAIPGVGAEVTTFDPAGRVTEVRVGDRLAARVGWRADGQPAEVADESAVRRFRYRADGTPEAVRVAPPAGRGWVEVEYDPAGRPTVVRDESGMATTTAYDPAGRVVSVTGGGADARAEYDAAGRPTKQVGAWGEAKVEYDAAGVPRRAELRAGGAAAAAEFDAGRPRRLRGLDGGEFVLTYPPRADAPPDSARTPNGLALRFEYGAGNRVRSVRCGDAYRAGYEYDPAGRLTGLRLTAAGP